MSKSNRRSETPAEPECIFCKIIAGDLPSRRIYEDDHAIAFLDIAAWHRGHHQVTRSCVAGPCSPSRIAVPQRRQGRPLRPTLFLPWSCPSLAPRGWQRAGAFIAGIADAVFSGRA